MGGGASVQLDSTAMNSDTVLARKDAGVGVDELVAEVKYENQLLTDYIARRDALTVKNACSGIGTDESAMTRVLTGRTKSHLDKVDAYYRESNSKGRKLVDLIGNEMSGNLRRVLQYRAMSPVEFRCEMIDQATEGWGCNESLLTETLSYLTNAELMDVREKYEMTRDKSLIDLIASECSGDYKLFIMKLLKAERDESGEVDEEKAAEQADELYKAGEGKWFGTDEAVFMDILVTSNPAQVNAINTAYENKRQKSLYKVIKSEFGANAEEGLLALLVTDRHDYLARRLRKAMKGFGTNEAAIARILGGAGDFKQCKLVAERFFELEDRTLENALVSELGGLFEGDFKRACLAMVQWPPPNEPTKGLQERVDDVEAGEDVDSDALLDLLLEANGALKDAIAETDAQEIYKACHGGWTGLGTDEKAIIGIMGNRTKAQLDRIDMKYRELFSKSLADEIKSETSGDFEAGVDMLLLLQMSEEESDAFLLKKATDGWGTDEIALIDVIAPKDPERLRKCRDMYEARYDKSLMDLLDSETSGMFEGDFNLIIKSLLSRSETVDESQEADEDAAKELATTLYGAMKGMGTDEKTVVETLCAQSRAQIAAVRIAFENEYQKSLESWLESDFGGKADDALIALCLPPLDYYCRRLRKAMVGWGTDESTITRILGSMDKSELGDLKARYFEKYDRNLENDLKKEVGGDWGCLVLTWVVGGDPTGGQEAEVEDKVEEAEDDGDGEDDEKQPAEEEPTEDDEVSEPENDSDDEAEDDDEDVKAKKKRRKEKKRRLKKQKQLKGKKRAAEEKAVKRAAQRAKQERTKVRAKGEVFSVDGLMGSFDTETYAAAHDIEDEGKAWRKYKKAGFWKGDPVPFKSEEGHFWGSVDLDLLGQSLDVSKPKKGRAPYTLAAAIHGELGSMPDEIPFSKVSATYMLGELNTSQFKILHPDLKPYWKLPKKGKAIPDDDDDDPYERLANNREALVMIQGRRWKVKWAWYHERYHPEKKKKQAIKKFQKKDWKKRPTLKARGQAWTVYDYYKKVGYDEERDVAIQNKLGIFCGTFSAKGYAQYAGCDEDDAWETFKDNYTENNDHTIAIDDIEVIKLFKGWDGVYGAEDEEEGEEEEEEDTRERDEDDGDDSEDEGDDDDGDDGDDDDPPPRKKKRKGKKKRRNRDDDDD